MKSKIRLFCIILMFQALLSARAECEDLCENNEYSIIVNHFGPCSLKNTLDAVISTLNAHDNKSYSITVNQYSPLDLKISEDTSILTPIVNYNEASTYCHQEQESQCTNEAIYNYIPMGIGFKKNLLSLRFAHIEGKGIGYKTGYTSLGCLFTPSFSEELQPIADVRAHCLNDGKIAGNFGGGLRKLIPSYRAIFGVNAYYDYRRLHQKNCHQIGIGIEFLSCKFDFRLNGYLPVGKREINFNINKYKYPGGYLYIVGDRSRTLSGIDAEIGAYLTKRRGFCSIYGAIGAYYYLGNWCPKTPTAGGRGRLAAIYNKWIRLEITGTYDPIFRGNIQGAVAFDFSLWKKKLQHTGRSSCATDRSMRGSLTQPVYRQEMIVAGKKHDFFKFNWCNPSGCEERSSSISLSSSFESVSDVSGYSNPN